MKHAREDYNRIQDPDHKIPENEPVFLLRGQDILAPETICYWANALERETENPQHPLAKKAREQAEAMDIYQMKTGRRKLPDMPDEKNEGDKDGKSETKK